MPLTDRFTELWIEQLKTLYSLERQLVAALPEMARSAESDEVKKLLVRQRSRAKANAGLLRQILLELDEVPEGENCAAIERLVGEWTPSGDDILRLRTVRKAVHQEIARLSKAVNGALVLGYDDLAESLQAAMEEELREDATLARLGRTIHHHAQRFLAA